jgi:hypothetical protein
MNKANAGSNSEAWFFPLVIGSLLVWGGLVALGAFLGPNFWADPAQVAAEAELAEQAPGDKPRPQLSPSFDYRKPLIVTGCVGAFVSMWGLLMWNRQRRLARQAAELAEAERVARLEEHPPAPVA